MKTVISAFTLFLVASLSILIGMYSVTQNTSFYRWIKQVHDHTINTHSTPDSNIEWKLLSDKEILITGLPAYKEDADYSRIPDRVSQALREELRQIEMNASGGKLSLRTNSKYIKVEASISTTRLGQMNNIISAGIDVYTDNTYLSSFYSQNKKLNVVVNTLTEKEKQIDIYLPLYGNVNDLTISIEKNASSETIPASTDTIVYYGSSITQGCCASNPAMTFPAIVSRTTGYPHINLGFAGNGLGDIELASFITELNPKIIILDYWANPTSSSYQKTLPLFVNKIRSSLPQVPILITSTFYQPGRETEHELKDTISRNLVNDLTTVGDANIYYVEDLLTKNESDGLIDSVHLNSYGFQLVANRLVTFIKNNDLFAAQ